MHHQPRHTLSRYSLILLYGLGILFSGYLSFLHLKEDAGRFCELFASDCVGAINSEYGEVAGFPVSTMALAYFVLQLLSTIGRRQPILLIRVGNLAAIAASAWFAYVMLVVIKTACIVCYGVHVVNLAAFFLGFALVGDKSSIFSSRHGHAGAAIAAPILAALVVFSATNLALARHKLAYEIRKTKENVSYLKYMHLRAKEHSFAAEASDEVIGKPDLAQHQIVLIYKDGCSHCAVAKEKLRLIVAEYPTAVYLILKDYRKFSREQLEGMEVKRTPAVFIDGRMAEGWETPGFLKQYTEDCGC